MNLPAIGIMQGRLSPSPHGRMQFSPPLWEREFALARDFGFSSIEWLLEDRDAGGAILSRSGRVAISQAAAAHKVRLASICFDYPMKHVPYGEDAVSLFRATVEASHILGVPIVSFPLLEAYAPRSEYDQSRIVEAFAPFMPDMHRYGVCVAFELEMSAHDSLDFIQKFHSPNVGVCYDIGNATSYGYDCPREIRTLGHHIFDVHLKDRCVHSTESVMLGSGNADFRRCLEALEDIQYRGPYIMQAWRGEDYLGDAKRQLAYLATQFPPVEVPYGPV